MGRTHASHDSSPPKPKSQQRISTRYHRGTHSSCKNRRQHKIMIDETEQEFVERMKTVEPSESILNALDLFNAARRELVLELKQVGWTDEQAHKQIMNYQQTSWELGATFEKTKQKMDENEVYDWQGRKKSIVITEQDLEARA